MAIKSEIRPATLQDSAMLFGWVNSEDGLRWKRVTDRPIFYDEHVVWLKTCLATATTKVWIILHNSLASGQIRLEKKHETVFIDIFVKREARDLGLGSFSLNAAINDYTQNFGGNIFCAMVHVENGASKKLFQKNGFTQVTKKSHDWLQYTRVVQV